MLPGTYMQEINTHHTHDESKYIILLSFVQMNGFHLHSVRGKKMKCCILLKAWPPADSCPAALTETQVRTICPCAVFLQQHPPCPSLCYCRSSCCKPTSHNDTSLISFNIYVALFECYKHFLYIISGTVKSVRCGKDMQKDKCVHSNWGLCT